MALYQKKKSFYGDIYNIYGLGKKTINSVFLKNGINLKTRPIHIKKYQLNEFSKLIKKGGKSIRFIKKRSLLFNYKSRLCKGIRQKKGYPVRGQRTHTNARTNKKLRTR